MGLKVCGLVFRACLGSKFGGLGLIVLGLVKTQAAIVVESWNIPGRHVAVLLESFNQANVKRQMHI